MKKIIFAVLMVFTLVAHAAEVVVLEEDLPYLNEARALSDSRFYMDTKTGEGFVKASVLEERYVQFPGQTWCSYDYWGRCIPSRRPHSTQVMVYSKTTKIEGLMLMGDQAVYQGAQGNVICGTMGSSRIFKVPTLYLSGNCKLSSQIIRNGLNSKLIVTLKTK